MFRFCLLVAGLFLLAGCGSDDPSGPEDFQINIVVRDTQGDPVQGLELTMVPDGPWYMDGKACQDSQALSRQSQISGPAPNPFFPATTIRFAASLSCRADLFIEDVERTAVRTLMAQEVPFGEHAVMWNGQNEDGQFMPSGIYHAHLILSGPEGGSVLFEGSQTMLLAHWGAGSPALAVTDANGRLELTDRKLFPFLYEVEPFPATDENGEEFGVVTLTATMRFYFSDPETERTLRFQRDVEGPSQFTFTWE